MQSLLPNFTTTTTYPVPNRDQPGLESVTVQLYKGRRYDGYVQFSSAEAAAAAKQVGLRRRALSKSLWHSLVLVVQHEEEGTEWGGV